MCHEDAWVEGGKDVFLLFYHNNHRTVLWLVYNLLPLGDGDLPKGMDYALHFYTSKGPRGTHTGVEVGAVWWCALLGSGWKKSCCHWWKRSILKTNSCLRPTDCICPMFYMAVLMLQKTKGTKGSLGNWKITPFRKMGLHNSSLHWKLWVPTLPLVFRILHAGYKI